MTKLTMRLLATTTLLAGGAFVAAPAEAQRVNRIVALGDSYIDDGNVFELTGAPVPPIYPLGRFSDGTNLVDTLSQILNAPVLNYGIGGAVARAQNTNLPQVQAFDLQVQSFLAGGGPPAFPRSSGRFAPDDLLIVNIGANDARAYERSLGVNPTPAQIAGLQAGVPAQAQLAASDAIRNLNALVAAGARNMTVLGGDVGRLPEVRGLPVAAVGTAYSTTYNGLVQQALAGYANQGVIVNYLDLNLIGDVAERNLAAFGLTGTGACPTACVTTNPELLSRYLFYVDQVHLTQAGYAIVGRYAARQLEAPLHFETQAETALTTAEAFGQILSERLDLSSAGESGGGPPVRFFFGGDYGQRSSDDTPTSLRHRTERHGVTAGLEFDRGPLLLGVAARYSRVEAEMGTGTGGVEADALQVGAYAAFSNGNAFVEGYAGFGRAELGIRRTAVIDEIEATPEADTLSAGARVGYLFDVGRLKIGPVVGIGYARASIEEYTEGGDPVLTLSVEDQEDDLLVGSLGVELSGSFDLGGNRLSPYLEVAAQKELDEGGRTIRYAGTAAPGIVNSWVLEPESTDPYAQVAAGVNFEVSGSLTLQVAGATTIGQEGGDDSSASVALRIGF